MSAGAVIGREEELGEIRACITASADGPAALTLAGEPGIGKTVLWEAGVEDARQRGYRVLVHRSVEAEAGFAFAGLSDLVAPVFDEVAGELAAPRRAALEVALLLGERGRRAAGAARHRARAARRAARPRARRARARRAGRPAVARRLVRVGAAGRAAAAGGRARRAAGDRVLGRRARCLGADRAAACGRSSRSGWLRLHDLLRERLGVELAAPAARAPARGVRRQPVLRAGARAGAATARVPESLRDLLGGRIARSPRRDHRRAPAGRRARAADGGAGLRRARRPGRRARGARGRRRRARRRDDGRLRFAHPLLASLCYDRAAPSRRRDAHRRLADVVADRRGARAPPRARDHRSPTPEVAAELDAASRARSRARRGGRRGRARRTRRRCARRRRQRRPAPAAPARRPAAAVARGGPGARVGDLRGAPREPRRPAPSAPTCCTSWR